ncbi:hypothetical protein ACFO1B_10065 [Dactylosporangium siamense]|uniref:Secreted protein n=1 Tax=Dactylosporangium siamense TaxID=685454 RepID=A0A919PS01_9ACTN|nr:hypothetical protein [Dactylosporangium siamense]GIG49039.1 hypothetical protein Dsi01nite_070800 [Dactylosporangium siamense]
MIRRRIRVRAVTVTLGLLAAAAISLATPGAAHAVCSAGTELTNTLVVNGTVYVTENPVNGTCNGNDYYQTNYTSAFAGWRASVHVQNNGVWEGHYGGYDTNTYYLDYTDNNSNSLITLCLNNAAETAWYCGFGSSYTYTSDFSHQYAGRNSGF